MKKLKLHFFGNKLYNKMKDKKEKNETIVLERKKLFYFGGVFLGTKYEAL